ncbi:MAG: hypothetical protein CMK74_02180 [Pseudomonadales bacterium]|nr:hypothetical protein [Pseudomonadales bacterium]|tara:strand:- start:92 stop:754 length:663 start_codon:yes stop_codon:yes gene_type:complete
MSSQHLILDLETTGLEATGDRAAAIVEMGGIALDARLQPIEDIPVFHTLVRPFDGADISKQAIRVNHHNWVLEKSGTRWDEAVALEVAVQQLRDYVSEYFDEPASYYDRLVMCGWNISFDENFMKAAFRRVYGEPGTGTHYWPFHHHKLDFLSICRYLDTLVNHERRSGYKLERIATHYFGTPLVKIAAHTALGDCQMCLKVLNAVKEETLEKLQRTPVP